MDQSMIVDAAWVKSEVQQLAIRRQPQDGQGLEQDPALRRLLGLIDVIDLIDIVDRIKGVEGEARSVALYRTWIAVSTGKPHQVFAAWYNLGVQLTHSGATAEAAVAFKTALSLKSDLSAAAINAGLCHEELGDSAGAILVWQAALQSDDDRVALLNHRGRLLETLKLYDEAERSLRASLLTNPSQPDAIHHWIAVKTKACSWPLLGDLPNFDATTLADHLGGLSLLALSDDAALHDRANASWIARKFPPAKPRLSPVDGYRHQKLRIGYMSSDYCMHPMAYLVADLFEQHDRDSFTIYGYCSTKEDGSDVRRRVLASFDHVRSIIEMGDEQVAQAIRADEIDILVDLNGLTLGTRLPVIRWRPAPVQITYLGYNGSIPLDELDYIVADRHVIPPEMASIHRPAPLYLPRCYQSNDRWLEVGPCGTRAESGLPDDAFVFCCFSNNYKITQDMFAAWMTILDRTEGTVLWLYADNDMARRNMTGNFIAAGLTPDRLCFAARSSPETYRGRLALADLFLDTFPYNAGTTASDALRVGLPIVTLSGRSFVSRMAGSLLNAVGLSGGIVETRDAYIELAVALATDRRRYQAFSAAANQEAWRRTLGDTPAFTRDLEQALKRIAVRADRHEMPSLSGDKTSDPDISCPRRPREEVRSAA